jgi:hypothetical protein
MVRSFAANALVPRLSTHPFFQHLIEIVLLYSWAVFVVDGNGLIKAVWARTSPRS